jgi:hypothetical protein
MYLVTGTMREVKKNSLIVSDIKKTSIQLENIILSDISQAQKAKSCMFSLICDYRPKTNAVILWDMGHTQRGHTREG